MTSLNTWNSIVVTVVRHGHRAITLCIVLPDLMLSLLPVPVAVASSQVVPGDGKKIELFPEEAFAVGRCSGGASAR